MEHCIEEKIKEKTKKNEIAKGNTSTKKKKEGKKQKRKEKKESSHILRYDNDLKTIFQDLLRSFMVLHQNGQPPILIVSIDILT